MAKLSDIIASIPGSSGGSGISDAPDTGNVYARTTGEWVQIKKTIHVGTTPPADTSLLWLDTN